MTAPATHRRIAPPRGAARAASPRSSRCSARDMRVVRKQIVPFLLRTIMQPLLTTFVFAYVFPKIGQGVGGSRTERRSVLDVARARA